MDFEVDRVRRAVARGVGHADLRLHGPHELGVAALVAVEALFAGEGRHDGFRLLVAVRVLHAEGPEGLARVLAAPVLVRARVRPEALPACTALKLPPGILFPTR